MTTRISHWLTPSYESHKITDKLYKNLDNNIDRFIEVWISKHGKNKPLFDKEVKVRNLPDKIFLSYLKFSHSKITKMDIKDLDLAHIRDEILEDLSRAIYLFDKIPLS
jgi:hypothetical protein